MEEAGPVRTLELLGAVIGPRHPLLLCCAHDPEAGGDKAGHQQQSRAAGTGLGRLLERPPFGYLRATVVEVVKATGLGAGLLMGAALAATSDRAGRLRFLVRLIACVAFVNLRAFGRLLVTVVPSRLLVGADPIAAHDLLQCLVQASRCSEEAHRAAEEKVACLGDVLIYERTIRMRAAIKQLQRHIRKHLRQRREKEQQQQQHQQEKTFAPATVVADAVTSTIPTTDEPRAIDLKSLPMRLTTRRRQRRSDDQPVVLCLSTATMPPQPPRSSSSLTLSLHTTSNAMTTTTAFAASYEDDDSPSAPHDTEMRGPVVDPHFKQLVSRSWRRVLSALCLLYQPDCDFIQSEGSSTYSAYPDRCTYTYIHTYTTGHGAGRSSRQRLWLTQSGRWRLT
jgi:hypothetical protein